MEQPNISNTSGEFLIRKSVFLLTPAVGKSAAENLVRHAMREAGVSTVSLTQTDMPRVSAVLEPALRPFVGNDQAKRLASALRVLVGGVVSE